MEEALKAAGHSQTLPCRAAAGEGAGTEARLMVNHLPIPTQPPHRPETAECSPCTQPSPTEPRAGLWVLWKDSVAHIPQLVECKDAFVCDIATGDDLQLLQTLLQGAGLAEPLQTLILDVHALLQFDICNVLQAICKAKGRICFRIPAPASAGCSVLDLVTAPKTIQQHIPLYSGAVTHNVTAPTP